MTTDDDGAAALAILRRFVTDSYVYVDHRRDYVVLDGDVSLLTPAEVDLMRRLAAERPSKP